MRKIRLLMFVLFGLIAVIPLTIGSLFLDKKQARKLSNLLEDWANDLKGSKEPKTLEDDMLLATTQLHQELYHKGSNKDLSIECRLCGKVTPRGRYFARKDAREEHVPYVFICGECYDSLPVDEDERVKEYLNLEIGGKDE